MDAAFLERHFVQNAYEDLNSRGVEEVSQPLAEQRRPHRLPCVSKMLKGLPGNSLLLDIGSTRREPLRADCFSVGVDFCLPQRGNGHHSIRADFVLADLLNLPFRDGIFDVVLLVSVLHHVAVEQRRLRCLRRCLALARTENSHLLVVVWAKEQQSAKFPASDVLVPYNLEDLYKQGHIPTIPFNKYTTKEQRIIMNSLPVLVENRLLRLCFQSYLPRRLQKQLLEMATRLAQLYPALVSIDFYEERFQHAFQFVIEHIGGGLGQIQAAANIGSQRHSLVPDHLAVASNFALKFSLSIFTDAFVQLRMLHREVLKYRYYHVFHRGELEQLFGQIRTRDTGNVFSLLHSDMEFGNWVVLIGRGQHDSLAHSFCTDESQQNNHNWKKGETFSSSSFFV